MTTLATLREETNSQSIPIATGWELAASDRPIAPKMLHTLRFVPAQAPGTVASALREQKLWRMGDEVHFDASDHYFRCWFDSTRCEADEEIILHFGGIATVSEVWLNGERILTSASMFASHEVNVSGLIRERNQVVIACFSLSRALDERRTRQPRARWRTRVVAHQQLRWFRATLLGRAPGFAPEPELVGPWRPVMLVRRRRFVREDWNYQTEIDGSTGVLRVQFRLRVLQPGLQPVSGRLLCGGMVAPIEWQSPDATAGSAVLRIPDVARWWPHTHGRPALYPIRMELHFADGSETCLEDPPIGFRHIRNRREGESSLALEVNGIPIFCRGVVWTPIDIVTPAASEQSLRDRLQLLRDGGFNLIRIAGATVYETDAFHGLCDELGLLVWQDMMFANMDYPFSDTEFRDSVRREAEAELSRFAKHPSSAVICGNSEIEQQVAMCALDPALGRDAFFSVELPDIAARRCLGIPYVPSAPSGGVLPFHTRMGVSNYFGVGAYLRPFSDIRRAEVQFASECLAFSNVPEPDTIAKMFPSANGRIAPGHPCWKRGVPRDSGAGWDFEDVRDHYLKLLYAIDPSEIRYSDPERYWELSRLASGEAMAEVFHEWRRSQSPCAGGVVLWCADLQPGAGWGILDSEGWPKAAYWFLKRALAPCAVWTTDEGLDGIDVHIANDHSTVMELCLRVAAYRCGEQRIEEREVDLTLPPHGAVTMGVEQVLGRFIDVSYAYRFGPPNHDLVVASLHRCRGDVPFAQAFHFPAGRSLQRKPVSDLGLKAEARILSGDKVELTLTTRQFVWGVRPFLSGFLPDDAYFGVEPSGTRRIVLSRVEPGAVAGICSITAANAEGRYTIALPRSS